MSHKVLITPAQVTWLHANHLQHTYPDMAKMVGCCVDTLKRILVREGLQEFDGAKYQVNRKHEEQTWGRPCLRCKDTSPRHKNHYLCPRCRRSNGYND